MPAYIFDTNVWRAVPEGRVSIGWWRRMVRRLDRNGHAIHLSVVNAVELGSHILDPRTELRRFREAFEIIEVTCNGRVLPDPEAEIEEAFNVAASSPVSPDDLWQAVKVAARAPSQRAFSEGFNATLGDTGQVYRLKAGSQSFADFRLVAEDGYIEDVIEYVIDTLNPGSLAQLRAGTQGHVRDKPLREELLKQVAGQITVDAIANALRIKANAPAPQAAGTGIPPTLDAYARYWVTVLRQVVQTGYDPVKRKNDFWDWQLLTHLKDDRILVTMDKNLHARVAGSPQAARIVTLDVL